MPQHRQDSSTKQLLQQVVEQLAAQTEELKHIRSSSSVTNQLLSAIHSLVQQLLQLVHTISTACRSLADAASSHLASIAAAQQAARLQATLSSGRIVMLLIMSLLALLNIRSSFSRQCLTSTPAWNAVLNKAVAGWAAAVLGGGKKAGKQQAPGGLLWSLAAPGRSGCCLMSFAGQYSSGTVILLTWTCWAWKRQQQQGSSASTAAAAAALSCSHTPASILNTQHHTHVMGVGFRDPIVTLLLAALPGDVVQTNSSNGNSSSSSRGCVSSWASLLQAGLYEGLLGCTSVRLLGGRWALWLLLWEGWLLWLARQLLLSGTGSDITSNSSSNSRGQCNSSNRVQCSSSQAGRRGISKLTQRTGCGVAVDSSAAQGDCSIPHITKQGRAWMNDLPLPHTTPKHRSCSCGQRYGTGATKGSWKDSYTGRCCDDCGSCDNKGDSSSGIIISSSSKLHPAVWLLGLAMLHVGLPVLLAAAGLWRG